MNNTETMIYDELMKLPRAMLFGMCREAAVAPPRGFVWGPDASMDDPSFPCGGASKDDAARALVPWLIRRDFMRPSGEGEPVQDIRHRWGFGH